MKYRIVQHKLDKKFTHTTIELLTKRFIIFNEWVDIGMKFGTLTAAKKYGQDTFKQPESTFIITRQWS